MPAMLFVEKKWYNRDMTTHSVVELDDTAAVRLSPAGTHSGCDITIQNISATATVYIGADNVSSSSYGYKIAPGGSFSVELNGKDSLYAVASVAAESVAVLTLGLE
jgi:hypothetical protein